MALIQGIGSAALLFDWPFGEPVQPTSMMAFLIVDAPITFALWCAIVIFLATGLRNRLVVAIGALALFGLFAWGIFQIPIYLLPIVTGSTAMSYTASDLLPGFIDPTIFAQRICALLVTVGLLLFAAVLHPRPDIGSSARRLGAATVLVGLGAAGIVALVLQAAAGAAQQTEWLAAHEARQDDPRVLVDRIAGRVAIEPVRSVAPRVGLRADDARHAVFRRTGFQFQSRHDGRRVAHWRPKAVLHARGRPAHRADASRRWRKRGPVDRRPAAFRMPHSAIWTAF